MYVIVGRISTMSSAETSASNEYRIIRRQGAVVPFSPGKISKSMLDAYLGYANAIRVISKNDKAHNKSAVPAIAQAASVDICESAESSGSDVPGGGAGGTSGGDDGDGDGDGDSDGPRTNPSSHNLPRSFRASQRARNTRSSLQPKFSSSYAHTRALTAFVLISALLLGATLALGLNGQPELAEKVLGTFASAATLGAVLLRPK
jgi:hypothetical protein